MVVKRYEWTQNKFKYLNYYKTKDEQQQQQQQQYHNNRKILFKYSGKKIE